jgi:Ca2+/Na+ antiporter
VTELPETINSFVWARSGKDALALGNISGAMVFQSTLPVAFGLAFTDWQLDTNALVVGALALTGAALAIFRAPDPQAFRRPSRRRLGAPLRLLRRLRRRHRLRLRTRSPRQA